MAWNTPTMIIIVAAKKASPTAVSAAPPAWTSALFLVLMIEVLPCLIHRCMTE